MSRRIWRIPAVTLQWVCMDTKRRKFPFVQFDVFTAERFTGNPLAVFTDGRGLSDEEMLKVAKEMNLSETTFVIPRDAATERDRGVRVRIFTVKEELPFAGHPTLGTSFCLRGTSGAREAALELNVGKIMVQFEETLGQPVFGEMRQVDPEFGSRHDREAVVRATGLRDGDIDPSLPIQTVSTGLPFTVVPLRGLEIIRDFQPDLKSSQEYLQRAGGRFFYFVTRETVDAKARLHARMPFYGGEDPATGSAAGCATAWMVAHGVAQPDERVMIEQGVEMGRPSKIFVRASRKDDRVVNVRVGGNVVEVLRGEVYF
jgi:trans-2,3-dihydro-3-hydroxyanthranilate isomerase